MGKSMPPPFLVRVEMETCRKRWVGEVLEHGDNNVSGFLVYADTPCKAARDVIRLAVHTLNKRNMAGEEGA